MLLPATIGLKFPDATLAPVQVPPAGLPPDKANAPEFRHTALIGETETTGSAFTSIEDVAKLEQPFPSV